MSQTVKPVPEGFHTMTPSLVVQGAEKAIEFYQKAFGAEVLGCKKGPDGQKVMHSELKIGNSMFFVNDEFPEMGGCQGPNALGGSPVTLHLYVEDVDALFQRAVKAGAQVTMPLNDTFWGDRYGQIVDPYGHRWSLASRKEILTDDEVTRRSNAAFAQMAQQKH